MINPKSSRIFTMKPLSRLGTLCLVVCSLTTLVTTTPAFAQNSEYSQPGDTPPDIDQPIADVSIETFEDKLAPHGRWIDTPEYGRVWIPTVDQDFQPYATNGRWVVTSYGNTWVSDYDWGWATFHYGRWYQDSRWGWAWVPGSVWGPAWVSWRSGDGYYGWAPLSPSVSININLPIGYWTFVPQAYITNYRVYNYCVPRTQVVNVYNTTTIVHNNYRVNNRTYVYGPRRQEIEQVTNRKVEVYKVERLNQPGRSTIKGQSVSIYQPASASNHRWERSTNNESSDSRRSYRQNPTNIINSATPSTNSEQPTERRRSYRQSPPTTIVNPVTPSTNSEQPTERRRSYRQSPSATIVNPVTPNTNSEQPTERRRSYRPSPPANIINPVTPSTNSERPIERRRSYRQSPPATYSTSSEKRTEGRRSHPQPSDSAPTDSDGRHRRFR
jgi:hypothetical protein